MNISIILNILGLLYAIYVAYNLLVELPKRGYILFGIPGVWAVMITSPFNAGNDIFDAYQKGYQDAIDDFPTADESDEQPTDEDLEEIEDDDGFVVYGMTEEIWDKWLEDLEAELDDDFEQDDNGC